MSEDFDEWDVAADKAQLARKLPPGGYPLPPSRRGRVRYKPCQIMRIWAVPSIKFVFLKDLSLNSSNGWSYGIKKATAMVACALRFCD